MLSIVPCAVRKVLVDYLFHIQQCDVLIAASQFIPSHPRAPLVAISLCLCFLFFFLIPHVTDII